MTTSDEEVLSLETIKWAKTQGKKMAEPLVQIAEAGGASVRPLYMELDEVSDKIWNRFSDGVPIELYKDITRLVELATIIGYEMAKPGD